PCTIGHTSTVRTSHVLTASAYAFLSLFFLHSYLDHRHLHSFPTRRSSDLVRLLDEAGDHVESGTGGAEAEKIYRLLEREFSGDRDRKSTRLNSSHRTISYAVFCLKKKKKIEERSKYFCTIHGSPTCRSRSR